jgi:hypothetical protein
MRRPVWGDPGRPSLLRSCPKIRNRSPVNLPQPARQPFDKVVAVGADDHSLQNFSELTPRFPIGRVSTCPSLAAQQAQKSNGETDAGHQRHRLGFLMGQPEAFDIVILGSGQGGKLLAWHLGRTGQRTAVVERQWVGGSCPAVACMPSKNEIFSARVGYLARHAAVYGAVNGAIKTDMATVRRRKRACRRAPATVKEIASRLLQEKRT